LEKFIPLYNDVRPHCAHGYLTHSSTTLTPPGGFSNPVPITGFARMDLR
jgi:hypothetical protein